MFFKHRVKETLMTAADPTGGVLAIVQFTDGRYGLTQDGEPIAACNWSQYQLDDCVEELMHRAGIPIRDDSETAESA